ncbi:MAG: peptidase, partial [Phenylobacterium sp.]|nr:peptidase [Phenylobacterium sp.]
MGRLIALTLALIAGALIAWSQARLPAAARADAPAQAFSAQRAMATVRALNQVPHPIGSAANHHVRDALFARMGALGLSPRIRSGDVVEPPSEGGIDGASPQSLIGVLPGRDRSAPAVALMAHYDSRPAAPGAADDGAGVATALEVVRAIRARGTPARDVVVILTDGEEACLCGAREVFAHDPVVGRLGLVLNLEARGSAGRALMFQTGPDDGAAIALFRAHAVRPTTGSLFGAVYARLPNDTDFSISRAAGVGGFNYAFTGGAFDYHAPTDTPAHLQPGAVQDLGDQALAVAAAAAFAPGLPPPRPDVVYGVLFGPAMVAYPPAWGWLVLALSAGM